MRRIDVPDAVSALPAIPPPGTPGWFSEGSPGAGQKATPVPAWFLNMLQAELEAVVVAGGIPPSKSAFNQLFLALGNLFMSEMQAFEASGNLVCPVGKDRAIILAWGAGGGGGGSGGANSAASGGGGGEFRMGVLSGLSGQTIPVVVGVGGAGGQAGGAPFNGENGGWTGIGGLLSVAGGGGGFAALNGIQVTSRGSGGTGGSGGSLILGGASGGNGIPLSSGTFTGGVGGLSFGAGYGTFGINGAGQTGYRLGQGGGGGSAGFPGGKGGDGLVIALFT
jgi:hypothetical protein